MVFDIFNRSSRSYSDGSVLTRTTSKPRGGGWRGEAQGGHYGLATIEPAFADPYFEGMETRLLLAVSLAEFNTIRAANPDLNLSANMADYNIIEVGVASPNGTSSFAFSEAGLRAAIDRAALTTTSDLIVIRTSAASVSQNTIYLGGELVININASTHGSVTIVSLGDAQLTLDAQKRSYRVLNISNSNANVSLAGLKITGGTVTGNGGGIYSSGTLTVTNSIITGNTASSSSYSGGGIYVSGSNSKLTVTYSVITGNTSAGTGGGIYANTSTVEVVNSVIAENKASSGGGLYVNSTSKVVNSTITRNTTTGTGGGMYLSGGTLMLANSIVVDNGATDIYQSIGTTYGYSNITTYITLVGLSPASAGKLPSATTPPIARRPCP